ncbi:pentapeptide repeat-containing protein [uncultured Stenotrophomonas sp.]|uniref:pentapeptide repeat-containing protein n=1 Tax=uncultured Stenotrophomonas sp. TaxID=165438 RepID=UPI0028D73855|nr:pentapeptide repeat-containing protein [uncultured Stenotrophomonas sp.]
MIQLIGEIIDMKIESQLGDVIDIPADMWSRKDMRNMMLHRAIFSLKSMSGFSFDGSDLRSALFDSGDFRKASFCGVRAMNALFKQSNLSGATFKGASLVGAVFDGADLRSVDFGGADVAFASFRGCDLRGAGLSFHRSDGADFSEAKIGEGN